MALILNIETSTRTCSVALAGEGKALATGLALEEGFSHSGRLAPMIADVLREAGKSMSALDAVAVSGGPGSYTGLRIGFATAKGICYATGKPLIVLDTLKIMATGFLLRSNGIPPGVLLCPMLDARRMEVYCAVFDGSLRTVRQVCAEVVAKTSFSDYLGRGPVNFFGDGAAKCRSLLGHSANAVFGDGSHPFAGDMTALAEEAYRAGCFADTAYCEPVYLKSFGGRDLKDMGK